MKDINEYNASVIEEIFHMEHLKLDAEQRERACRERHEALKYHRYDHNTNYLGYEGL